MNTKHNLPRSGNNEALEQSDQNLEECNNELLVAEAHPPRQGKFIWMGAGWTTLGGN